MKVSLKVLASGCVFRAERHRWFAYIRVFQVHMLAGALVSDTSFGAREWEETRTTNLPLPSLRPG